MLLGGLPEEGLAKAGLKISSKVHISAAAENIYLLKVKIRIMFKKTIHVDIKHKLTCNKISFAHSSLWNLKSLS